MDCGNCGYENRVGDTYCRRCGRSLGLNKPREKPVSSTSGSKKSSALKIGKKPLGIGCLLGPIVGGGISSIVGVVVGHISSLLYTLVGDTKNTGLAYLLSGVTFVISFGMSMGLSTIAKRIGLKPK